MGAYSLGYNGHAKCCKCQSCYDSRAEARYEKAKKREMPEMAMDKPIFVSPHWRRGNVRPETLKAHRSMLRRHRES